MSLYPTPLVNSPFIWKGLKIGLLGGSFNPAHDGHVHISNMAIKKLGLDAVWWLVSPQNPLKSTNGMADINDRISGAEQITKSNNKIIVTDIENHIKTRYTADSLKELQRIFLKTNFVWLMGGDNLQQIHKWDRWMDIFNTIPIAVLNRPPYGQASKSSVASNIFADQRLQEKQSKSLATSIPPAWIVLNIPLIDISATEIRDKANLAVENCEDLAIR